MTGPEPRGAGWAPHLYLMVGLPGCGKTTYARQYLGHALRVSLDDLRLMLTGRAFDPRYEAAVAAVGAAALGAALAGARAWQTDVLFDATNVSRARRRPNVQLALAHDIVPVAVYLECPLDLALARNRRRSYPVPDEVVERFQASLEPPDRSEGFADVLVVKVEE